MVTSGELASGQLMRYGLGMSDNSKALEPADYITIGRYAHAKAEVERLWKEFVDKLNLLTFYSTLGWTGVGDRPDRCLKFDMRLRAFDSSSLSEKLAEVSELHSKMIAQANEANSHADLCGWPKIAIPEDAVIA